VPGATFSTLIIDWAGTVTVPMHEMFISAAKELDYSDSDIAAAFGRVFAEYLLTEDSPVHQAERGEIDDDDLRDFVDEKAPGVGRLFEPSSPSFFHGADRPEMIGLLEELRDANITVVLATNNFRSAQDLLASRYLDNGLAAALVNSAMVGVRKPEPEFYELCVEVAGVDADQVVFVDDQERNLLPAKELGMYTVLVGNDATQAIAEIRYLLLGSAT
jgi:putative hydrolase of the HAD superfamily